MALATMWLGVGMFSEQAMLKIGDGTGGKNDSPAIRNMVKLIQIVLGNHPVTGYYGSMTHNRIVGLYGAYCKENPFGFTGNIIGQRLLGKLMYKV